MTIAVRPQSGPTRGYRFPRFERRQLDNGLKLIVAPVHKLPVVTVVALVDAGAMTDPRGKEGLAQLTARAITEGTVLYDGEALTDSLERLGTSMDTSADWDAAMMTLTVLTGKLPEAFSHFANVLITPTFPSASVERIKGERIAEILQVESEPRELANEMFDSFVYAAGSLFTMPVGGTKSSISSVTRQDVSEFYAARYHPSGTTLIVVGDVDVDSIERMVAKVLYNWAGTPLNPVSVIETPARTTRAIHIVRKSDAPQSELRVGHVSVPRTHLDYFKLTVMNAILGGLFSSRINLNLREAHGYTYGAHSEFDWRRAASPFVISTAVESNVTAAALQEVLYEIDRIRNDGITESELSLATSYLDGVFPIRFETTSAIATALATLTLYNLPDDWYDTYRERIRGVTTDDVLEAVQAHIDPQRLQVVVIGSAETIREQLEALRFGPLTMRDSNSELGSNE
jgi:zinc protease